MTQGIADNKESQSIKSHRKGRGPNSVLDAPLKPTDSSATSGLGVMGSQSFYCNGEHYM